MLTLIGEQFDLAKNLVDEARQKIYYIQTMLDQIKADLDQILPLVQDFP